MKKLLFCLAGLLLLPSLLLSQTKIKVNQIFIPGSNKIIQYNNNSMLAGSDNLTFDSSTNIMYVCGGVQTDTWFANNDTSSIWRYAKGLDFWQFTNDGTNYSNIATPYAKNSTFFGYQVGEANTGSYNTFFGHQAGKANTTGHSHTFIGEGTGINESIGNHITAIGRGAYGTRTTGTENVAIGSYSLAGSTGNILYNTSVGVNSGYAITGNGNVYLGYEAGKNAGSGANNVAIGYGAGEGVTGTANKNIFIGVQAGNGVTNGANNTIIGYQAGDNITTGSNNIMIVDSTNLPTATTSNWLNIGNVMTGSLLGRINFAYGVGTDTLMSTTGTDTVTIVQLKSAVDLKHTRGHSLGSITDHIDVDTSGITDGQGIKWDTATSKWLPADLGGGITIEQVKADTDIASTIALKHTTGTDTILQIVGPQVNQSQLDYSEAGWGVYGTRSLAQTFIPSKSGNCSAISVYCDQSGTRDGIVEIRTTLGDGTPSDTVLGTETFGFVVLENKVIFDPVVSLTLGTTYAIVLDFVSETIWYNAAGSDVYANGKLYYNYGLGDGWEDQTNDLFFKVWLEGGTVDLINSGTLKENLAVDSGITIDGRDISVDGAKLEGIEVGAVSLATVKADADISDVITRVHDTATVDTGLDISGQKIYLEDTAVTPGSYTATDLTVDAQGRITAASNGAGGTPYAATHPVVVTGSVISMGQATTTDSGFLSTTDWNTFNGKLATNGNGSSLTGITQSQVASLTTTDTPTFAGLTITNRLDASKVEPGTVSNAEYSYLDGVSSPIQTQMNLKAPIADPTFTGTVTTADGVVAGTTRSYVEANSSDTDRYIANITSTNFIFGTETYDLYPGEYNPATGILTVTNAGTYLTNIIMSWYASAVGYRQIEIRVNNATVNKINKVELIGAVTIIQNLTSIVTVAAGNTINVRVYQNSGGILRVNGNQCWLQIYRLF